MVKNVFVDKFYLVVFSPSISIYFCVLTPLRVLYCNPLCSVGAWPGHTFLPLVGTLLAVLLEHFINSVQNVWKEPFYQTIT